MRKRLTQKQEKFAHKYIQNEGNATKAALETYDTADYDTASQLGHKNLRIPAVRSLVQDKFNKDELTTDYVLANLKSDIEFTNEPNPYRTRALEMIAKFLNMFGDKPQGDFKEEGRKIQRDEMFNQVVALIAAEDAEDAEDELRLKTGTNNIE